MQRPLGLHQSSVMDISPLELIETAAAVGYDQVSLFTHNPVVPIDGQTSKFVFPMVTKQFKQEVKDRLDATGLKVINAEFFLMKPDIDLDSYRAGLALGRDLGARNAVSHVFDTDRSRAVEILGRFCDIAESEGLKVVIEFCQMTPGCKSIDDAAWFVDQVGSDNIGFSICPMHLVRSGGTAADVLANRSHIAFGQINDGKGLHTSAAYFDEVHDRELPGNGDFPLQDILGALPLDVPIEVKIPSDSRIAAGLSAKDYVTAAYERARPLVSGLVKA